MRNAPQPLAKITSETSQTGSLASAAVDADNPRFRFGGRQAILCCLNEPMRTHRRAHLKDHLSPPTRMTPTYTPENIHPILHNIFAARAKTNELREAEIKAEKV